MAYQSTLDAVLDLEKTGQLIRIDQPVDSRLEISLLQRLLYQHRGPAVLFENVRQSQFPMLANLYGTTERARFVLRHGYRAVETAIRLKGDPASLLRQPQRLLELAWRSPTTLARWVSAAKAPVLKHQTQVSALPQHVSWPQDGGPFVTLPAVYSEVDPLGASNRPLLGRFNWLNSNLGMYRVQLGGNQYTPDREVGLHYQLHRGIGVHHSMAIDQGQDFYVNIFVGGPPALAFSAVMPLPEGLPELALVGLLSGRAPRLVRSPHSPLPIMAEADFCIVGKVDPNRLLPEGPFGDHLGYYSLAHPFPVLQVQAVYHRPGAIWPFTTVGRPPQEDTVFGHIIHELTGPALQSVLKGVKAVHAVDEAGVHPLLLAIAQERYTPYLPLHQPQELLTMANAILGQGQLSLAKYLWIASAGDDPNLDINDIARFFGHILRRVDWARDLHFQTQTTIDTLDYSGPAMHRGSKLVVAAVGPPRRELPQSCSQELFSDLAAVAKHRCCIPGILALSLKSGDIQDLLQALPHDHPSRQFPLWVVSDDADFTGQSLANFLWETFTRSDPASDTYGYQSQTVAKHWGCQAPLVIDATSKPHHAPKLVEDPALLEQVARCWGAKGQPLHGYI